MLLVNKLAVHHIPLPGIVTLCQFVSCAAFVYGAKLSGMLVVDDFEWSKAKFFAVYVLAFSTGTYSSMKVLSMANVETIIVFRSCAPLAVSVFDYIFYHRAAPSLRSCVSLLMIMIGALAYILTDHEFRINGLGAYFWVLVWWSVLVFQLTYGKFLVSGLKNASLWTPVLYTNTLAIVPTLLLTLTAGEFDRLHVIHGHRRAHMALVWLLLSCMIGTGISWAGFWCQSLVSATTYTVVGVMNKFLTVTANALMWDKHASSAGLASLGLCLLGGTLYQQAPLREVAAAGAEDCVHTPCGELKPANDGVDEDDEEEIGGRA